MERTRVDFNVPRHRARCARHFRGVLLSCSSDAFSSPVGDELVRSKTGQPAREAVFLGTRGPQPFGAPSAWPLLRITPFSGPRDDLLRDNHLRRTLHFKTRGQKWKQELIRVLHLYLDHATWVVGSCFADGEVVWRSYPCSRRRDLRWIESHARNIGHVGLNVRRTRRTATG